MPYQITSKTTFDQRIEVNLRNSSQDIILNVEALEPTYLRITTEQDIGMDVDIRIINPDNSEIGKAKDIGATETIVVKADKSGLYKVKLIYRNSIIRNLMSCPQLHLSVSSLSDSKSKEIGKKQSSILEDNSNSSYEQIESLISKMQSAMDNGETYENNESFDKLYVFSRESYSSIEEIIYENKLTNTKNRAYWIYFEIF